MGADGSLQAVLRQDGAFIPAPVLLAAAGASSPQGAPHDTPPGRPPAGTYRLKRVLDVILAVAAIVILAPLLALIWLSVVITSPGPGLHWSLRVGRHGAPFWMPKFRTMFCETPLCSREDLVNAKNHITPLGRLLRRFSFDELPQLFCILRGEMSFVGPRPLLPNDPAQAARTSFPAVFAARPGLSGLAQVSGRNLVSPRRKARLDALYARAPSWRIDARIFVGTLAVLITGRGFL